ncbi:MAG TPA: isoprenylcysteine carboxylmethyltransferase family protein [Minicystis sp.]|nr:isoprenylcysteine carboxylmethyltransferase family protein [Minicystis sp.]
MIDENEPNRTPSEDPSRGRSTPLEIASLVGYALLGGAAVALIARREIFGVGLVAQAIQVLGLALMVWARVTFRARSFHLAANATEGGLVTTGPYRFVRHPVYASALVILAPAVATHASIETIGIGALALVGVALRVVAEERLVTARYPEYAAYAKRTKRLVPFVF